MADTENLVIASGSGFTFSTPHLRCPQCGTETAAAPFGAVLSVSIAPYAGSYCLTCYAAWIAATVPKLEPVP